MSNSFSRSINGHHPGKGELVGPSDPLLLDVSRLVWRAWAGLLPTGIDRTCLAYVEHYMDRAQAVVQRGGMTKVLPRGTSRQLFEILLRQGQKDVRARLLGLIPSLLDAMWRRQRIEGWLYLNVGHTGLDREGHSNWVAKSSVRPVYFVHDLIPLTHPEYCRPKEPEKHLRRMRALLAQGVGIIANSRDTLNELAGFAGLQASLTMPPGLVAPLGAEMPRLGESGVSQLLPNRPYFVMLGTIEGRKNHLLMLNIWAEMARLLGADCPMLVIIGQRGWESEQAVDMLERNEAIRGHVVELARCSDQQLLSYMRQARALLFPSFVEGYGLPLVEALTCGTPVIASDLPVFHELAGSVPDYLNPIDGLGWAKAVQDYTQTESPRREAQLSRISNWVSPTWQSHFARVDQWLRQFQSEPGQASAPND